MRILPPETENWSSWIRRERMFVCVEVLQPNHPNGVMSSVVSLSNHTFTGQARSSKRVTSIVHILSPETANCPSWISGRERMTIEIFHDQISTKNVANPAGDWTRNLLITSRTCIQLSHRGREWPYKIFHGQSPQKNVARPGGDLGY